MDTPQKDPKHGAALTCALLLQLLRGPSFGGPNSKGVPAHQRPPTFFEVTLNPISHNNPEVEKAPRCGVRKVRDTGFRGRNRLWKCGRSSLCVQQVLGV